MENVESRFEVKKAHGEFNLDSLFQEYSGSVLLQIKHPWHTMPLSEFLLFLKLLLLMRLTQKCRARVDYTSYKL